LPDHSGKGRALTVETTAIEGLLIIRWDTHGDDRGFFRQTYQRAELAEALGREPVFAQGNHSRSAPGVIRGFHAEPWDKLVYVVRGTAMAAIADIRPQSSTFGQVVTHHLGDAPGERCRLFISEGLANSFCTYGEQTVDYLYDVSDVWRPDIDKPAIAWNDPDLAVTWPIDEPSLSDADAKNATLRELFPDHARFSR
jgi:dTDP-4-dehydrorhamnose 3,5-epimerase